MRPSFVCSLLVFGFAGTATAAEPSADVPVVVTHPVSPSAPWALAFDDDLAGVLRSDEPPLPAQGYDATPGILYVAMDGVTVRPPPCGGGDEAHSAKNCSPLVDAETAFPSYGSGQDRATLVQTLQNYYDAYNIVLTSSRPPDWVPYTMAVIGGSSASIGQPGSVCGIANVKCDGLRRNHVSLTFPQTCGGVAAVAAQETAHNWGLEHVDVQADIMYPVATGGTKTFRDECMAIVPNDNPEVDPDLPQCGFVHDHYCAGGNGNQQNSHQELLGVFGPRDPDTQPPEILEILPNTGTITSDDTLTITATVAENTNFLAAHWTWVDGLPEDTESFSKCTNSVCDQEYSTGVDFDPNVVDWDFLTLDRPPVGVYVFKFEVADSYGGYDTRTLTIQVEPGADSGNGSDGSESDTTGAGTSDSDSDSGTSGTSDSGSESDSDPDDSDSDTGDTDTDTTGIDDGDKDGCGCIATRRPPSTLAMLVLLLAAVRRRR